jgi:two-component sensor histidine kinase
MAVLSQHMSNGPIHDESGTLVGIVGISYDITPRKAAEEKQSLLIRELHHRVQNMLSTVQAIMATTARTATSLQDFQAAFAGRISALAQTQDLLTDNPEQSVLFRDLLRSELDPYDDQSRRRITLEGPPVLLPSDLAVPLGMAVHELTTNAAKHGALSQPGGSLVVHWQETWDTEKRLLWHWKERNGPPVERPSREGFGTRLLNRVLTEQIGADVRVDFARDGLEAVVLIPFPKHL